jgi:hypothetical protein
MKRNSSKFSTILAAAVLAGISGAALADDSSMNPFTGDSNAFFNGCNVQQHCRPTIDNAPSAFHKTNPHGLSENDLQAIAAQGPTRDFTPPVLSWTPSEWRAENPHGLSESELQAISSENATWQYRIAKERAAAVASTHQMQTAKTASR